MNPPPTKSSRNAANWMLGLGVVYGVIAVLLGGASVRLDSELFARLFALMFGGEVRPATRGAPFDSLIALIFGGEALVLMLVTAAFLVTQRFVRRGSRLARNCGAVFCVCAASVPLPPVLLFWGAKSSEWSELAEIILVVALWMLPDAWLIFLLLFKARADTTQPTPRAL